MIRTFLAVELTEDLRTGLGQVQENLKHRLSRNFSKDARVSWVQPACIHFTIKFLGDTDEQVIDPMRTAITQAMEGQRTIHVPLERLGVFPSPQQPRVLWVGASERWEQGDDATRLAELHRVVEESCRSLGFAPEARPLTPHVTLARIKAGGRDVGRVLAQSGVLDRTLEIGPMEIRSIVLMKSDLRPAGPVYTKLWEVGEGC